MLHHRSHSNDFRFFHRRDLPLGSRIGRDGIYSYCHLWILTLKGYYAEELKKDLVKVRQMTKEILVRGEKKET